MLKYIEPLEPSSGRYLYLLKYLHIIISIYSTLHKICLTRCNNKVVNTSNNNYIISHYFERDLSAWWILSFLLLYKYILKVIFLPFPLSKKYKVSLSLVTEYVFTVVENYYCFHIYQNKTSKMKCFQFMSYKMDWFVCSCSTGQYIRFFLMSFQNWFNVQRLGSFLYFPD